VFAWLPVILLTIDWLIRIGLSLHIVMRRKPPPSTMAWIAIVMLLPIAGAVAYLLLGELRLGADRERWRVQFHERHLGPIAGVFRERGLTRQIPDGPFYEVPHFGAATGGLPPLGRNRVELIHDSDRFLEIMREHVERAERTAFIQTYVWHPSDRSERLVAALIDAAGRGVDCRLLLDGVGCHRMLRSRQCQAMRDAGVRVVAALPVGLYRLIVRRPDVRNHRKIAVFDSRVALCGSQNITDASFGMGGYQPVGPWVDASVLVEGPGAQVLQMVFLRDWEYDARETLADATPYIPEIEWTHSADVPVQVVPWGPGAPSRLFEAAFLSSIYSARREVWIASPYFVPDEAIFGAIAATARRGVDIRLIVPRRNDSLLVGAAARSFYGDLLEAGARIFEFEPSLLHTKAMAIDDEIAVLGSANLDVRSFFINFEVMLFVYDRGFTHELRGLMTDYFALSREVTMDHVDAWPFPRRLGHNLAQLARQIL